MYNPAHFEELRTDVLHELIREHPLGVLVTLAPAGLEANHLPFELDPAPAPLGTLKAHVSRANSVWSGFSSEVEALVVFQASQAYVTPSWYATKRESGKVVPTFNYAVVHAYGSLRAVEDPAWLRRNVEWLTRRFESPRPEPWKVTDAPEEFIEKQLRGIVGLELTLTRLIGKWKMSQNRSAEDREGVVQGLRDAGDPGALDVARTVEERGKRADG